MPCCGEDGQRLPAPATLRIGARSQQIDSLAGDVLFSAVASRATMRLLHDALGLPAVGGTNWGWPAAMKISQAGRPFPDLVLPSPAPAKTLSAEAMAPSCILLAAGLPQRPFLIGKWAYQSRLPVVQAQAAQCSRRTPAAPPFQFSSQLFLQPPVTWKQQQPFVGQFPRIHSSGGGCGNNQSMLVLSVSEDKTSSIFIPPILIPPGWANTAS